MITFAEFNKVELRVGTVLEAVAVMGSDKLLRLLVDIGESNPRQIISGIAKYYEPATLVGKQLIIAANLEPRQLMGFESQGMVLACGADEPILLTLMSGTTAGSLVR